MTATTNTCDLCDLHKSDDTGSFRVLPPLYRDFGGIRALAAMPMPTVKRNEGQSDIAVCIHGHWLRPGEWLVADRDGIVVLTNRPT